MGVDIIFFAFITVEMWNIPLRLSIDHDEIPFYIVPYIQKIGIFLLGLKIILSFNTGIFIKGIIINSFI